MNNKGITLIEVIASVTVLALVAIIVVPNIFDSAKNSKMEVYQNQVSTIENASKNWAADHVDDLPTIIGEKKKVTIEDLQTGGYMEENYQNVKTGKPFSPLSYVEITCTVANETNYNYTYQFKES